MIQINKTPSRRDLLIFGAGLGVLVGLGGGWLLDRGLVSVAHSVWALGSIVILAYFAVPSVRRPVYLGWSYAFYPVGWLVSHVVMLALYLGVITPIGLALRLGGRDAMGRRSEPGATTYWKRRPPPPVPDRYFRQF